jgi:hypothetical protein
MGQGYGRRSPLAITGVEPVRWWCRSAPDAQTDRCDRDEQKGRRAFRRRQPDRSRRFTAADTGARSQVSSLLVVAAVVILLVPLVAQRAAEPRTAVPVEGRRGRFRSARGGSRAAYMRRCGDPSMPAPEPAPEPAPPSRPAEPRLEPDAPHGTRD